MTKNEAEKLIEYVFTHKFEESFFEKFISNIFKKYKPLSTIREGQSIKDAFKPQIIKYKMMGSFSDAESNDVDILLVALNNINTLQRSRTMQRNFVADYLNTNNKEAAIVAFVTDKDEWRFSLVKLDHSLQVIEDKLKTRKEITPARRWSFLVGKNEGSHTAQSRFIKLLTTDEKPNLAELESAFNIESVTKEFFDRYTELFFSLQEYLEKLIESDDIIKKDFLEKDIKTSDFAKKTLGQIVFLYFLQKKGWFGVASDKEWGSGPKNFLREIFNRREKYGKNFFNDILEPLFYEGLAQDRGESAIYTRLNNVRMPFLNGGLFEPMNNYKWEETNITIPDELFSNDVINTKTGDKGTGILDVFDRYNFTVNENEPLEQEVAVDPEMLGKVFENLLEIKDRKSKGAFYTPREIVHYMCQETLINYLESKTGAIPKSDIEFFIKQGELILENDKTTAEKKTEKEIKGYEYKGIYNYILPQSIIDNAKEIDKLLLNIKVADPAVGSGAFPLGMLNEIVRARRVIGVHTKDNKKVYTLKKETISNSLYGVDLDPGAVEIAKLRLWLSLVVDENIPHPLPNLDHKIIQGNSLISEYEGIKLFDDNIFLSNKIEVSPERKGMEDRIKEIGKELIKLAEQKIYSGEEIEKLEKESMLINKKIKKFSNEKIKSPELRSLFEEPEQIDIIEQKTRELTEKTEKYIDESQRSHKQILKREIDELKWDVIEMTLRQQGREDKIDELENLRSKNIKPFLIWKLEFVDVFKEKEGFDVVIGNPPYVKNTRISKDEKLQYIKKYETLFDQWDLYIAFFELGLNLLNSQGVSAMITPNQWLSAKYGIKLRNILADKILKFADFRLFSDFTDASVNTFITINKKMSSGENLTIEKLDEKGKSNKRLIERNKVIEMKDNLGQLLSSHNDIILKINSKFDIKFSDIYKIGHSFSIPDFYKLAELVYEKKDSDSDNLKLVSTGTLSFCAKEYGTKKFKYSGKEYLYPVVNKADFRKVFPRRIIQSDKKLIISSMGGLKIDIDVNGEYLGTRPTMWLSSDNTDDLKIAYVILSSKFIDWYYNQQYSVAGMTGFKIRYSNIEQTPMPLISKELKEQMLNFVNNLIEKINTEESGQIKLKLDEMVMDLYELTDVEKKIIRDN